MSEYLSWHAGMRVVCIDASPSPGSRWVAGEAPVEGRIYTIASVFEDKCGKIALSFVELKRSAFSQMFHGGNIGYWHRRFRPVQTRKTSIEVFERLLISPKLPLGEDA